MRGRPLSHVVMRGFRTGGAPILTGIAATITLVTF